MKCESSCEKKCLAWIGWNNDIVVLEMYFDGGVGALNTIYIILPTSL